MAYGKLAEGARPWDSAKNGAVNFEDANELADQLKGMLGPRQYVLFPYGFQDSGNGAWNAWEFIFDVAGVDHRYHRCANVGGAANQIIWFPLRVYAGQVITEIEVAYAGDSAAAQNGGFHLRYGERGADNDDLSKSITAASPWNTGGANWANKVIDTVSNAPLPLTVLDDYYYAIRIESADDTGGGGKTNLIFDVRVTLQFGN
jgi:hypothetical protein